MRFGSVHLGLWLGLIGRLAVPMESTEGTSDTLAPPATASVSLEVLQRLKGMDLDANPGVRAAVMRALATLRGTPAYVELVRDFRLRDEEDGLLDAAERLAGKDAGAEAVRLLLAQGDEARLRRAVHEGIDARRSALVTSLAAASDPRALQLLSEVVVDTHGSPGDRARAVRGLASFESGARELLRLAEAGRLDEPVSTTAALALAQSRWPELRAEAGRRLPLPLSREGRPLPTLDELLPRRGDAERGAAVFRSEAAGCVQCHRVGEVGIDFGPDLTLIGAKLGTQALYESILDPSAGIAFGYEAWTVETRDGEEYFGLLVSETAEELVVKQAGGVSAHVKASTVLRRGRQTMSIMPAGLAGLLTVDQLVDLVEYLASLGRSGERLP